MVNWQLCTSAVVIIIGDHFCIALFCALEQRHGAHVACDSEWVTVAFYNTFFNIHWSGVLVPCKTGAIWAQVLCTPYKHALVYSVVSFKVQACTTLWCHFNQSTNMYQFTVSFHSQYKHAPVYSVLLFKVQTCTSLRCHFIHSTNTHQYTVSFHSKHKHAPVYGVISFRVQTCTSLQCHFIQVQTCTSLWCHFIHSTNTHQFTVSFHSKHKHALVYTAISFKATSRLVCPNSDQWLMAPG